MKIGIITFHWAINYGAVIQAWALQTFLESAGHKVIIIDYEHRSQPRIPWLAALRKNKAKRNREKLFKQFSEEVFKLTTKHYTPTSINSMKNFGFDAYIAGSDQIWNIEFLDLPREGMNYSYFLDFVEGNALKISYAASIGNTSFEQFCSNSHIMELLKKFDAVSAREVHAVNILKQCGLNDAEFIPDPTVLLEKHDYLKMCIEVSEKQQSPYIFGYILGEQQRCKEALEKFSQSYDLQAVNLKSDDFSEDELSLWDQIELLSISPSQWIGKIAASEAVITDSFHGTVISVILNKPFVSIAKMGNNVGQNERLNSFLHQTGLLEHMVIDESIEKVPQILKQKIDWQTVNYKLTKLRECGKGFLISALNLKT